MNAPEPAAGRLETLRGMLPQIDIRLRRMRRGLLTARRAGGRTVVTLHPALLQDADCPVFISAWVVHQGRHGTTQRLNAWLGEVRRKQTATEAEGLASRLQALPTVGDALDLAARAQAVHAACFTDLDLPRLAWSRQPPRRRLRHLRFGCYRRGGEPTIELSPRLARPWVALCFVDHVLHHELCHHRQFRQRIARSEGVHSPRFRAWERDFPQHDDALLWERLALPWLLDDRPPPWYPQNGSSPCIA